MYRERKPKKNTQYYIKKVGPNRYKRKKMRFNEYVAKVFCDRVFELGMSATDVARNSNSTITQATMSRILNGVGNTSINSLAIVADLLDMEIIIRPKQKDDENKD